MNRHLQQYIHSWKLDVRFLYTFIIDGVVVTLLMFLFLGFGKLLEAKAYALSGGRPVEEVKMALLSATPETAELFLQNVKTLAYLFILGSIIVVILALFLFSLSRAVLWYHLLHKQLTAKNYWRWNVITLVMLLLLIPYLLLLLLLRFGINILLPLSSETADAMVTQGISFLWVVFFFVILFLVYHSFAERYKVWESLGQAFHQFKTKGRVLWIVFFFSFLTGIIISLLYSLVQKNLLLYQTSLVQSIIGAGVLLLFLSWMRLYLLKAIKAETL